MIIQHSKSLCSIALASAFITSITSLPGKAVAAGSATALMDEILVLSRKRSAAENVQDVPLAITAYGAEQLDALFVKNLQDLNYAAPNVQLESVGTFPGVQNFSIRGQGINSSIPSVDPTVGTFIDGIYLGVTFGVVVDMFDLESVEVLRGPQGLLFGRNVTGGAVVLRTARPDGEFGFRAKADYSSGDQQNYAAAVEGALIEDQLAGKLVVYYNDDEGYFDGINTGPPVSDPFFNLNPTSGGEDLGALRTRFARGTLVFTPNDSWELTLIGETGDAEGDGAPWTVASFQREGTLGEFDSTIGERGVSDMDWDQLVLEANIDVAFGDGRITNIAGWREVDVFSLADVDGTAAPLFSAAADTAQDQFSNELRYAGSFADNSWDTTVGLYYFEQDVDYNEGRYIFLPPALVPPTGILFNRALGGQMDHETWGLFWSNDIHLNEAFTLTGGLRYTREEKDAQIVTGNCADVVDFVCSLDVLSDDWSNITPKLGLNWRFRENAQLYAFWTKGFRSGGVNFRNAKPDLIPPGPTNEEDQNSYEIGIKSDWADGRIRLNAAYFYNTIDDMQRELNLGDVVDPASGEFGVVVLQGTINAGDVTIQGVELDFVAVVTENFSLFGSLGYLDGEYDSKTALAETFIPGTTIPFVGDDLPRLSPWTSSFGLTYDFVLENAGTITVRGSYSFRDEAAYNDSNTEIFPSTREVNASVNYTTPGEQWKVSLYGKNLNDEARWGNLTSIAGLWTAGPMQKGEVYGVEVSYRY